MIVEFKNSTGIGFAENRRGSISIISAAFIFVAVAAAALAVDMGSLYTERRTLQGATDLAAMAAANDIPNAEAVVAATLKANGIDASFEIVRGQYTADADIPAENRFNPGQRPFNALRVDVSEPGQIYFARAFTDNEFKVGVSAVAANSASATFSIGSRLLSLRGGVVNKLLSGLLGSEISLSVMDYDALIKSEVQLLSFMDALAAHLNITAGTYSDVLNASVTVGDIIAAIAEVTDDNGDSKTTLVLTRLVGQVDLSQTVRLSALINLGHFAEASIGSPNSGLDALVSVMQLVSGSAVLANGSRQVEIDLAASVPGLLGLTLGVAIGEPPQYSSSLAVGQGGSVIRTAQTRLNLVAEVGGTGVLSGVKVRLPIYLDLAYGEARLASTSCSAGGAATATIAARSGIAEAWVGEVSSRYDDFEYKPSVYRARIVDTPLIKVLGFAHLDVGSMSETMLTFDSSDVADGTIKRTSTSNIAESAVTSLLKDLRLDVQVLGLGLALPTAITGAVADTLAPVAKPIDAVVFTLLETLGVHLGEADVRVHGIGCGAGVLAG